MKGTSSIAGGRIPVLRPGPTTDVRLVAVMPHGRLRRVLELTVVTVLIVALSPLLIAVALLVRTTSPGPVLYRHRRIGAGGQPFYLIKFRTMYAEADAEAEALFAERNDGSGPLRKLREDPRVTPVGRWLRRFSLDELTQLWNVLNGTMALVGPRPMTHEEAARFAPREHGRHRVRPGMTGITQVSGRSDLEWERAIALDLDYIEHRSLRRDLLILLRTGPAVLTGRGAY